MLHIFCGDDTVGSRTAFAQAISKLSEQGIQCIPVHELDQARTYLQADSLFQNISAVSLENALSRKTSRDALAKFLPSLSQNTLLYIWESAGDPKILKKQFPNAQLHISTLPSDVWKFLDALVPGNLKSCMRHKLTVSQTVDEHVLLFLMQRRAKDMLVQMGDIPSKRRSAPWQAKQLRFQAQRWGKSTHEIQVSLMRFYKKLYDIEAGAKSGTLTYSINNALDICLCFYLQ